MRQADGALDLRVGHIASHREADVDRHDAVRIFLGALGGQFDAQPAQLVPPFPEDVHDVHTHAARERKRQAAGTVVIDGVDIAWELRREAHFSSMEGLKGMQFSARAISETARTFRELIGFCHGVVNGPGGRKANDYCSASHSPRT